MPSHTHTVNAVRYIVNCTFKIIFCLNSRRNKNITHLKNSHWFQNVIFSIHSHTVTSDAKAFCGEKSLHKRNIRHILIHFKCARFVFFFHFFFWLLLESHRWWLLVNSKQKVGELGHKSKRNFRFFWLKPYTQRIYMCVRLSKAQYVVNTKSYNKI